MKTTEEFELERIESERYVLIKRERLNELLLMLHDTGHAKALKAIQEHVNSVLRDILIIAESDYEEVVVGMIAAYINRFLGNDCDPNDLVRAYESLKQKGIAPE